MQIKDLTVEEFQSLIRETIEDTLQELLLDPDESCSLKADIRQQLLQMRSRRQINKQTISSAQLMEELGLS